MDTRLFIPRLKPVLNGAVVIGYASSRGDACAVAIMDRAGALEVVETRSAWLLKFGD